MRYIMFALLLFPLSAAAQTDSRVTAIQKACAAGVFTAEECKEQLAKLKQSGPPTNALLQPPAQANTAHWSEPHGRYTIAVAPGWQVDDSQANLKVTKGASWAIFDTESKQTTPADVAQTNAKQMSGMVSGWQVLQQQPFETPRHHPSAGITAIADVPTRGGNEQRVMTFAAQSAGSGNFVILTASSLKDTAQADQGQVMSMFNSVRLAGEQ